MTTATPAISSSDFTVAAHYVRLLAGHCESHGLPTARLLSEVELPIDALDDVDARIPFTAYGLMMEFASESLRDPNLGLHLGQAFRPGYLGAYGLVLQACTTFRDLIPRMVRYAALMHDACRDEVEERDGQFILRWRSNLPDNADPGRHHSELNFASIVVQASWMAGVDDETPLWVSFRHSRPANIIEHEALFACPLHFGAAENAIAFAANLLDLPLLQPNPPVLRAMEALSEQMLQKLQAGAEPLWVKACKKAIVDSLRDGTPEVEPIAAKLNISARNLRRRLADRNLNFRNLVDDLRHELAKRYMEDPTLDLEDIAFLLGFSEQSAFQRAFRRWTGETPGRLRRSLARPHTA